MVRVKYESVEKRFGDTLAVEDIDIAVEDGEFAVLLGPSGCGKTTTLRCLSGLTEPTSGRVYLDDYDVTDVHPKNRNTAMVFQNFALYPHMNVRKNIAYPLKVAGVDKATRQERVDEVAEMLEIPELLDRDVGHLSGGQRQRVALGRAIIRRPSVFLMDEPLANLDAKLKISMRGRIKVLQKELGITTLYVTHDQEEAMTMGDKLIVMDQGHIQQVGTPDEVYHEPTNRFVAGFIGSPSMNFIDVEVSADGLVRTQNVDAFEYRFESDVAARYADYDHVELGVRPQYFTARSTPGDYTIEGTVEVTEPLGDEQIIDVVVGDESDAAIELTVKAPSTVEATRNEPIWLGIRDELVHGFDPETGQRIAREEDREHRVATSEYGQT
ncbi:ABC transporter ATP-binding protein [Halomicrococcus sp. NG-SE-24]|uniref:ABC transporter ATP-binding protein n=1 Tax=Halomicrococcus sp. NG-SE-24 TaxID=3436928 RepID=UPI003D956DDB